MSHTNFVTTVFLDRSIIHKKQEANGKLVAVFSDDTSKLMDQSEIVPDLHCEIAYTLDDLLSYCRTNNLQVSFAPGEVKVGDPGVELCFATITTSVPITGSVRSATGAGDNPANAIGDALDRMQSKTIRKFTQVAYLLGFSWATDDLHWYANNLPLQDGEPQKAGNLFNALRLLRERIYADVSLWRKRDAAIAEGSKDVEVIQKRLSESVAARANLDLEQLLKMDKDLDNAMPYISELANGHNCFLPGFVYMRLLRGAGLGFIDYFLEPKEEEANYPNMQSALRVHTTSISPEKVDALDVPEQWRKHLKNDRTYFNLMRSVPTFLNHFYAP